MIPTRTMGFRVAGARRVAATCMLGLTALAIAGARPDSVAPVANAHGGAASTEYRSKVTSIHPDGVPIKAKVLDGDDRIVVEGDCSARLLVEGYEKDPYLRIEPAGVFVNKNSKAWYLNNERFGNVALPEGVGEGKPQWSELYGKGFSQYSFHDHRIHWMLRKPPPNVDPDDSSTQKVSDWSIPFTCDGRRGEIRGRLDYIGGKAFPYEFVLLAFGLVVFFGFMGIEVVRRRRRKRGAGNDAA